MPVTDNATPRKHLPKLFFGVECANPDRSTDPRVGRARTYRATAWTVDRARRASIAPDEPVAGDENSQRHARAEIRNGRGRELLSLLDTRHDRMILSRSTGDTGGGIQVLLGRILAAASIAAYVSSALPGVMLLAPQSSPRPPRLLGGIVFQRTPNAHSGDFSFRLIVIAFRGG